MRLTSRLTSVIFCTKDERINSGVVIQMHHAQRPKLFSVEMECCLVVARVY